MASEAQGQRPNSEYHLLSPGIHAFVDSNIRKGRSQEGLHRCELFWIFQGRDGRTEKESLCHFLWPVSVKEKVRVPFPLFTIGGRRLMAPGAKRRGRKAMAAAAAS